MNRKEKKKGGGAPDGTDWGKTTGVAYSSD